MGKPLLFLYLSSFVTILGFGMVFPLLPFYAERFGMKPGELGLLAASFSIAQFVVSPIFGRLSDRFGRKPILALSLAATALAFLIFAAASSVFWLYFSRILHGISSAATFPTASAYIGDITSKKERVEYMGKLNATFALGFIFGPAVSGILSGVNLQLPFLLAAFISFSNFLFIAQFLPESITKKEEKLIIREGLVNIKAIILGLRGEFGIMFFLLFAWAFAISNFQVAIPLFAQNQFNFEAAQTGLLFGVTGIVAAVTQWVFLPKIVSKIGELGTIASATFGMGAGQALIAVSPNVALLVIFTSASTLGGALLRPVINAQLSEKTKEGQGTTMGLAFSFEAVGRAAGPILAGLLITAVGDKTQFILTSLVLFAGFMLFIRNFRSCEASQS